MYGNGPEYALLSDDEKNDENHAPRVKTMSSQTSNRLLKITYTALIISVLVNVAVAIQWVRTISNSGDLQRSFYGECSHPVTLTVAEVAVQLAGLTRDVSIPWVHNTEYATTNLTEATNLWESIDFDSGFIALPHDYAASKHLPQSQNFPWDPSKGIYVVNGYHSLHCLKSIHASLREFHLNRPQSYPLEHVTHCIDSLRRETLCAADDTPRWTSQDHDPESGVGQIRQCRDWSKLEAWVQRYNSCYNRINEEASFHPEIERYRFCPPGSPYGDLMRAYFERVRHKTIEDSSRLGG